VDLFHSKLCRVLSLCLLAPVMSSTDRERRLIECKQYSLEEMCVWQESASGQATQGALLDSSSSTNSPSNDLELGIAPQGQGTTAGHHRAAPGRGGGGGLSRGCSRGGKALRASCCQSVPPGSGPCTLSSCNCPCSQVRNCPCTSSSCNCPCSQARNCPHTSSSPSASQPLNVQHACVLITNVGETWYVPL